MFYVAAIGTDGIRDVVWGVGDGETLETAQAWARIDATTWLEESPDVDDVELSTWIITREQYDRVLAGDVSIEGIAQ